MNTGTIAEQTPTGISSKGGAAGFAAVVSFVGAPTLTWLFLYHPAAAVWAGWMSTASYLGKTVAVPGAALFCLSLILSARIPLYERLFGDLSASYRAHQRIGGLSLILLSAHPIGLALGYLAISPRFSASFLLPLSGTEKTLGIVALLLLQSSIVLTYWDRIPYHLWKLAHKALGLAVILGIVHALTIPGAIAEIPLLKGILAIYLTLGIGAWVYRSLVNRWLVPRKSYRLKELRRPNGRHAELVLEPEGEGIAAKPGQFAFLTVIDPSIRREEHPFSVSAIGPGGELRFIAKSLGDFTSKLPSVKPEARVLVEGPYGRFGWEAGGARQVWIAGGIGVTPFVGMAESLPPDRSADLYYSCSDLADAVALEPLASVANKNPRFRLIPWMSAEKGLLTVDEIARTSGALAGADFFLCGPTPMVASLRKKLLASGVLSDSIHEESFNLR